MDRNELCFLSVLFDIKLVQATERVYIKCVFTTTLHNLLYTHMSNPICNTFSETWKLNSINGFWGIGIQAHAHAVCVCACVWCTTKSDEISIPPEQIIVALEDISWATQKITISLMKDYTRGFLDSISESLTNIYIEVVRHHTHDIPWICNIEYTFTYGNGWVVNCTFSCLNNKSNPFWYIVGHFL